MPTTAEQLKNVLKVDCKLIQTLPVWLCPWALCYPAGYSGKANENEWDAENGKKTWKYMKDKKKKRRIQLSRGWRLANVLTPSELVSGPQGRMPSWPDWGSLNVLLRACVCVWGVCWQGSPTATAADVAVACFFLLKWSGKRRSVRGGSRQAAVVTVVATSNSSGRK